MNSITLTLTLDAQLSIPLDMIVAAVKPFSPKVFVVIFSEIFYWTEEDDAEVTGAALSNASTKAFKKHFVLEKH
jgi:hypothetical protein